jgi:caa(3)-type oxidase subunit IV
MSESHDPSFYVKIWGILLALLVVSVVGPMFEIQWLTLITAFGIAVVKAYLVAVNFMHINLTPRYVTYMMTTALVFMLLFYAGTAPDVMKDQGQNWKKPAWIQAEADYAAHGVAGAGHGEGHGGDHH